MLKSLLLSSAILFAPLNASEEVPTTGETTTTTDENLTQEEVGLIVALATIYLKYRKYKSMSSKEICEEVKKEVMATLSSEFQKLSKEQQETIIGAIDEICKEMEDMKKALVISQDKTYEGKLAMLKLLEDSTKENSTKEEIKKVETQVKEEKKKDEEVKEKVKKDYVPVD